MQNYIRNRSIGSPARVWPEGIADGSVIKAKLYSEYNMNDIDVQFHSFVPYHVHVSSFRMLDQALRKNNIRPNFLLQNG